MMSLAQVRPPFPLHPSCCRPCADTPGGSRLPRAAQSLLGWLLLAASLHAGQPATVAASQAGPETAAASATQGTPITHPAAGALASSGAQPAPVIPPGTTAHITTPDTTAQANGSPQAAPATLIWTLSTPEWIGGQATEILGRPQATEGGIHFDGKGDAVIVPSLPIAGARAFTIEVLFRPDKGGPAAQRFVHLQDEATRRSLIELRLDERGNWWLDTFLSAGLKGRGLALIDPRRIHPADTWAWVALRYDGKTLSHHVNGVQELAADYDFPGFGPGRLSLGARLTRVHWFQGTLRELRFTPAALPQDRLQRLP